MRMGFGFRMLCRVAGFSGANKSAEPTAEPSFCKCTTVTSAMSSGRVAAVLMEFAATCAAYVKYYNDTNPAAPTQIGTTKTVSWAGSIGTAASVVCADGVPVRAVYTCTTTAEGFKAVTAETILFERVMNTAAGNEGPWVPNEPTG